MAFLEKVLHAQVCAYLSWKYPKVLFNSDMAGVAGLTVGQAAKIARLRSSRGFPDLVIYEPNCRYHGLFIELKREGEKLFKKDECTYKTPHLAEQAAIIHKLKTKGFEARFCIGFNAAVDLIDNYLSSENSLLNGKNF